MALFKTTEENGHDLVNEFEAFIASHKEAANNRAEVVRHRLEELEAEHKALADLLNKIGL